MSNFRNKHFEGALYTFEHLTPLTLDVSLTVKQELLSIPINVTFGCHCFTEKFDSDTHGEHFRYQHLTEVRAFDVERYQCSLHLPSVIQGIVSGTIYRSDQNYTYVTQINLPTLTGLQPYSIFFSLEKTRRSVTPAVEMYVKSAYISALKSGSNAQNWRFKKLIADTLDI